MPQDRPASVWTRPERPRLAAHIRDIWTGDGTDVLEGRFTFGLDRVLDGLATRLPV
jgi:hypothetical protein